MNIENDINAPLNYSWDIVTIILEVVFIILLVYFLYDYFWIVIKNYVTMPRIPTLKQKYLKKLQKLERDVKNNNTDLRELYLSLSKIIREFINKSTGINVLNLTKNEIKKYGITELSLLMEEYYPPEFSRFSNSDIIYSIKRTMDLIKQWD